MKPIPLLAAILALAGCGLVNRSWEPGFYVMRHLQKAEGPDPGLSEIGRRNAEYLADMFDRDPPRTIYASTTRRARETARPVAERLGLPIKEYDPSDTPGLIARVRADRKPVLIVGHSNTVPAIVAALGGRIGELGENDYGMLYVIAQGRPGVIRRCIGPDCIVVGVDDDG